MYALTEIKGVGRRYSNIVCKKADVDLQKRYVLTKVLRRREGIQRLCITAFRDFLYETISVENMAVRLGTTVKPSWLWCKRSRY